MEALFGHERARSSRKPRKKEGFSRDFEYDSGKVKGRARERLKRAGFPLDEIEGGRDRLEYEDRF